MVYVGGEINSFWEAEKSCRGEFWEDWEKQAAALNTARSLCANLEQSEREAKGSPRGRSCWGWLVFHDGNQS